MKTGDLPRKVAVLMGGPGSERDVSMATGRGVSRALRFGGIAVVDVDVRDENFPLPPDVNLAFNCIHGTFGEDGQIQKILEDRGVAYTGDGVEASRIAFDKVLSKEKFLERGVSTPESEVIDAGQRPKMSVPLVVKAARQGSTVGIVIVKNANELDAALKEAAKFDRKLLIEKFVSGRELTIGILGDQALPIIEIIP
ncbi:MAG TPA: D-alanine--D-alanine ligase, partial [Chthoniobacterales bacterium]